MLGTRLKYFFLLVPSLTFGLLGMELAPWSALFVSFNRRGFYKIGLFLLPLSTLFFLSSINSNDIITVVADMLSLLNGPLLLVLSWSSLMRRRLKRVLKVYVLLLIVVGSAQVIVPSLTYELLNLFIPRGSEGMTMAGRGISLLDTEPARAGQNLLFAILILQLLEKKNLKLRFWLILLVVQVLLIRSATGLIFTLLALLIVFNTFRFYISFVLPVVAIMFFAFPFLNSRGLSLIIDLLSVADFDILWKLVLNESGFRGISIFSSYTYGFTHFPALFGSWEFRSIEAMNLSGVNSDAIAYFRNRGGYHSVRPPAYFAHLFLEFGVLAIPIVFVFFRKLFQYRNHSSFRYVIVPIVCLFFLGSIGNPMPWLVLSLFFSSNDI